jgi:hypothetical protein
VRAGAAGGANTASAGGPTAGSEGS